MESLPNNTASVNIAPNQKWLLISLEALKKKLVSPITLIEKSKYWVWFAFSFLPQVHFHAEMGSSLVRRKLQVHSRYVIFLGTIENIAFLPQYFSKQVSATM